VGLGDAKHETRSPAALPRHRLGQFRPWESEFLKLVRAKPTLVIRGDKDPYVSSRFAERFNAQKVVHLPQAGHWAAVEAPDECADAILQFFAAAA
jgi:pimeloyl-ACP methyl ester carboxylesterase